jgi:hypothetical protein
VASSAAGLWLSLFFATGLHTYWLHPRHLSVERQNRAVALGYYACGPLLMASIGCLPIITGMVYAEMMPPFPDSLQVVILVCLFALGGLIVAVGVTSFLRICFVMAGHVADRGPFGRWSLLLIQPPLIALLALLLTVGLFAVLFYLYLIASTF